MLKKTLLSTLCVLSFSSMADTVWLKSGDTLTGTIRLVDGNKLMLATDFAGDISINRDKIKTFSVEAPVEVQQGMFGNKLTADKVTPAEDGSVVLASSSENKTFAITDDFTLLRDKEASLLSEFVFKGYLNAGAYYNKGTSKNEQYMLDGNLTGRYDLWRHGLSGSLRRANEDGDTSTYNYTVQYNIDRFFTPSFFWKTNAHYKHDWIEDIKSKTTIGTGPGYQVWDNELSALSFAALMNYQHIEYRDEQASDNPVGSLLWDYHRFFSGKAIRLFTTGQVGRSFDDSVDLDLSAVVGISYNLTDWFSLNTTVSRDKSKTKDGDSNNTNYSFGVGVNW